MIIIDNDEIIKRYEYIIYIYIYIYVWMVCICVHIYTLYRRKHACVCVCVYLVSDEEARVRAGRTVSRAELFCHNFITQNETQKSLIRSHAYKRAVARSITRQRRTARTCVFNMVYYVYLHGARERKKEGREKSHPRNGDRLCIS